MPTQRKGKILDVGCGSGDTLVQLRNLGWAVYGLDIDTNAITVAKKRGLRNVSAGSYQELKKYPDNFFDVVRMYHVIEHIPNPAEYLNILYRKLKPTGEIIIGTPNISSLVAQTAKQYWYNLDSPRHVFLFTPKTLGLLLKRHGFSDFRTEFCSAGGWLGSIQYKVEELLLRDVDLINRPWLVMLLYPFEWLLDKLRLGDVFVLRAKKTL